MQQAIEPMWYTDEDGKEHFVAQGTVLHDSAAAVQRMPAHFRSLGPDEAATPKGKAS
jgi:hypothetical protein